MPPFDKIPDTYSCSGFPGFALGITAGLPEYYDGRASDKKRDFGNKRLPPIDDRIDIWCFFY
jgi:hypothetical protein